MKLLDKLNKIKDGILDAILPVICVGCSKEGQYICKDCEIFLSEIDPSTCEVNAITSQVSGITSVWAYEGLMEKIIHKIKYERTYDIIDELIEKAFEKISLDLPKDTVITFVPMFKKKEKERGFNQADLIARKLAFYLPMADGTRPWGARRLLEKVRDTKSQTELDAKARLKNVKDAFRSTCEVNATTSQVNNVLLVDDVYTSGATMAECRKVLKKAGVKNVWGFTLARTV